MLNSTYVFDPEHDVLIRCRSCEVVFLFGGGEKDYFDSKELQQPNHCAPCRRARREGRQLAADSISEDREDREVEDRDL